MSGSSLSPDDIRAAAETHRELGPEYQNAVIESFLDRIGREIDARVDARIAGRAQQPAPQPAKQQKPSQGRPLTMALGSIMLGIPVTAIAVPGGHTGVAGLLVIWVAIAVINVAYALSLRRQSDGR